MGGYYTYSEIGAVLDQMAAAYPDLVSPKVSIGTTLEGRSIWMIKVSDNPTVDEPEPEVRIDAMHHAREPQGMQTTLYFVSYLLESYGTDPLATYLIDERELYVLPCVNPDGYEFNRAQAPGGGGLWRKNRRDNGGSTGVDLNRNYPFEWGGSGSSGDGSSEIYRGPSPASEPETAAMVQFISSREFATSLSVHTYSNLWLSPWGYDVLYPADWPEMEEIGDLATEVSGYVHGPVSTVLYEAAGNTIDFDYGARGTLSWTPEIGSYLDGFWPAPDRILPLAEENRLSFARTVLAAGPWLRPLSLVADDAGDGDGSFEPGEDVELRATLRNSGLLDSGTATLELAVASPFASVTSAVTTAAAASFETAQGAAPLRFTIDPATPPGTSLPITVTVTDGSRQFDMPMDLTVSLRTIASFDFEATDDEGWSTGRPNDAQQGRWTRDDPVGAINQPEDDHTPGAGTKCWLTGQGLLVGGFWYGIHVQFGSTTLVSPAFDLSGATVAKLRYARWYANLFDDRDDPFRIELSGDDGASWTPAETVGPTGLGTTGGWIEAELDIGSFVPLTSTVRARFIAADLGFTSIVEAAIDDVEVLVAEASNCTQPTNYCSLTPNHWTAGATIGVTGSTDVGQNALSLTVNDANPNGFGLFLYGQGRGLTPLGNGNVCIAGNYLLLPAVQTDASGAASYTPDLSALPVTIANGDTWNFQFWLRDVGGAGSNFSDGLEVEFCAR